MTTDTDTANADSANHGSARRGSVALGLNMQATWRMIAIAFVCVGAVVTAALAALVVSVVDDKAFPRDMGPAYFRLFVVVGIVLAGASFGVVWLRQPRGARIDWSDWGVTEWDGDGVRCAIPRATLKMGTLVTKMRAKNLQGLAAGAVLHDSGLASMPGSGGGRGFVIGGAVTLGDDDGRRIYAGQGTQLIWLNDRLSSVGNIKPLLDGIGDVPGMPPEIGRSGENKLVGVYLLGIIHYVTLLLGAMMILVGNADNEPGVLILFAASTLFGVLRALVPMVRAARLNRAARKYTERATIERNEGTSVVVKMANGGETVTLDPRPWKHADAALHERRGNVRLTKERDGLETDGIRAARASRVLALRIEAVARLLLAGTAAALLASQLAVFEKWKNVIQSTNAVTPVFFDDTSLLRLNQGVVERAHEDMKAWLPLRGAPTLFAPGPSNTIAFKSGNGPVVFQSIGAAYDLNFKAPMPPIRMIVAGEEVNAGGPLLVVTASGEGQLWRYHSIDITPTTRRLAKSMATATIARFTARSERLLVAYSDGSVDCFDPDTGALRYTIAARGNVKAIAPEWSVAVADDRGVRWFDDETGAPEGSVALANIALLEYGHYPTWSHQPSSAWLAITSANGKHTMHALDSSGRIERSFDVTLPRGEKPVALTTTPREVLVATDKGGVWQLWIH